MVAGQRLAAFGLRAHDRMACVEPRYNAQ
jgi:hypothetical protein